jgi:hypothetical protein
MDLKKLKLEYSELEKKFGLPSFSKMNEDFDIEKIELKETDFLLREVRRAMLEKNVAYLRFLEMVLNPSNSPMFMLILLKNITNKEKQMMNDLYIELGKYEISSMALDNIHNEEKEAEFINNFYNKWQAVKQNFASLISGFESSWDHKSVKKEKGYLG